MSTRDVPPTLDALLSETDWIRALAHRLIVDPGTADDVAQDATVVALTKPPTNADAVRGWLRRVVRNLASNARRGESRRGAREAAVAHHEAEVAADEVVARWEIRRQVVEAVLALDEPYRTTILLRFFDGLTAADCAARMNVAIETARTRTRRGLELLRGRLAHLDDGRGSRGAAVLFLLAHPARELTGPATSGVGGAVLGGVAVASTTKVVGVAALLLLGIAMTWSVVTLRSAESARPPSNGVVETAARPKPRRAARVGDASDQNANAAAETAAGDRELDLFGVVVDPDGKPVADATVTLLRKRPWALSLSSRDEKSLYAEGGDSKSRADGTFSFRLSRSEDAALRVDAVGFATWESQYRQAGERVTVRLVRALVLDVHVRTSDGSPVVGAPVCVSLEPANGESVKRRALTDASGLARFERMPRGGKGSVSVSARSLSIGYQHVEFVDAESQSVDVTLPADRVVHGTVVDAFTKAPLPGARVAVPGGFRPSVSTDALGRFDIAAFAKQRIVGEADGYSRSEIAVPETGDVTLALALAPAARVTGRVVDAEGKPLKDADVAMIGNAGRQFEQSSASGALSAADGTFAVEGLIPGRVHFLRVQSAGHALLVRPEMTAATAPYESRIADVVLLAPHLLRGSVVDVDDTGIARASVRISGPDGRGDSVIHDHRLTDDLGRFAFPELPPGTYEVKIDVPQGFDPKEVVVPAVGDPSPVNFRIGGATQARAKIPVRARITDEDGNPVVGAQVQVNYVANGGTPSQTTGDDGAATFEAAFEPASVWVSPKEPKTSPWSWSSTPIRPGQRDVTVVLRRGRTLHGRVLDENDRPVWEGWVAAFDGPRQVGSGSTNRDGEFAFAVPSGAKVDLQATPKEEPGVRSRSVGELRDVAPGAENVVVRVVKSPATRSIDVEVIDASGSPVAEAWIRCDFVGRDWNTESGGTSGADGRVRVDGLPRGPVIVSATVNDRAKGHNRYWSPQPRRIAADADSVRIVVGKPRTVRGRVVLDDGTSCPGAIVMASTAGALQGSMNVAESDGRFEINVPADAPTPFTVNAAPSPPDPNKPRTGYDVVDAEDRELSIVIHDVPKR